MTFIDDVLAGRASLEDLDSYFEAWDADQTGVPAHTYIGLLWPEYAMWVHEHDALEYIIRARREGRNLLEHLEVHKERDSFARELWELAHRLYAEEWRNPEWSPDPK